jgi:hypothetical protein
MSIGNEWDLGDLVTVSGYVTVTGTAADPSHIEIHIKNPNAVVTTASALRSATGVYYNSITATIPGDWVYQFSASGSVVAVGNGQFKVRHGVL